MAPEDVARTVEALPVGTLFIATWLGNTEPDLRVREGVGDRLLYNDDGSPALSRSATKRGWDPSVCIYPLTEDDGARLLALLALNREQGVNLMRKLSR